MVKETGFLLINLLIISFVFVFRFYLDKSDDPVSKQEENHAPVVKIVFPKDNSFFEPNTTVRYKITVSDKEDGESRFGEINPKEVFMQIKYVSDTTQWRKFTQIIEKDPPGFAAIRTSNCMNCHAFKSKLIGPSFYEINKRYQHSKSQTDSLATHIIQGSSGIWGTAKMPANNDLGAQQAKEIVDWIFNTAGKENLNYYAGTEGAVRLQKPNESEKNGAFILTASYTDHGVKNNRQQSEKGQDQVIMNLK